MKKLILIALMAILSTCVFAAKSSKNTKSIKRIKCGPQNMVGSYTTKCGKKYNYYISCACCTSSDMIDAQWSMASQLEGLCDYKNQVFLSVVPL